MEALVAEFAHADQADLAAEARALDSAESDDDLRILDDRNAARRGLRGDHRRRMVSQSGPHPSAPSPRHVPSAFSHHRVGPGQGPRSANPVRTATSAVEGTDRLSNGGHTHERTDRGQELIHLRDDVVLH